jgi:hypothetical protein
MCPWRRRVAVSCSASRLGQNAAPSLASNTTMPDIEAIPALRISHVVHGRMHNGKNKVTYLVHPAGEGSLRAVPETVVLRRWRQRRLDGYSFAGSRLSATLWRAVAEAFGDDAESICRLSREALESTAVMTRAVLAGKGHLKLPSAETLVALFAVCGPSRLKAILGRHLSPEHAGLSGVPDLFLYAVDMKTGRPAMGRFVEVKKPREPVSVVQRAEIEFLRGLGLQARVLRLIERKA